MRYFDDDPEDDELDEEVDASEADGDEPDDLDDELTDQLDEDFPLGDGSADTESTVHCPYCGEAVEIALDPGGGASQAYVEDCQVCCQPWRVHVQYGESGAADVWVAALDE